MAARKIRPLTRAETRTAVRLEAENPDSIRDFFAAMRAAGINRRESDVLRPARNKAQDARLAREMKADRATTKEIDKAQETRQRIRTRSLRRDASPGIATMVKGSAGDPKAAFRYQGYINITEGSIGPKKRDFVEFDFGSSVRLSRKQIEKRARSLVDAAENKYKLVLDPVAVVTLAEDNSAAFRRRKRVKSGKR